jgi:hypothetical protein
MRVYLEKHTTRPRTTIMNTGDYKGNLLLTGAHQRDEGAVKLPKGRMQMHSERLERNTGTRSESVGDVDTGGVTRSPQSC